MEIKGKVHCFFEQSGTFKNEFLKLGIPAEDYDIQNNFNQTDHVVDLFGEIEKAYANRTKAFYAAEPQGFFMRRGFLFRGRKSGEESSSPERNGVSWSYFKIKKPACFLGRPRQC